MKLETFYNLLVKEFTVSEGGKLGAPEEGNISNFIENRKDVLELSQKFLNKTNFYTSYLLRTILELILALILLAGLCGYGIPTFIEVSIFFYKRKDLNFEHYLMFRLILSKTYCNLKALSYRKQILDVTFMGSFMSALVIQ